MDHPLPWKSDMERKVPFFAGIPHYISIEDANGNLVAQVPIYDGISDGKNEERDPQKMLEEAQARVETILEGVNQSVNT